MIDLDHIAIAIIVAALRHGDHAAICGIHRRALSSGNINAEMPGPVIIAGEAVSISRPGKPSASDSSARTSALACR